MDLSHFSHPFEIFGIRDEGTYCLEIRRMHVSKRKTGAILNEFIRPTDPCLKVYKSKVSLFCRSICLIRNNDQEFGRNKCFCFHFSRTEVSRCQSRIRSETRTQSKTPAVDRRVFVMPKTTALQALPVISFTFIFGVAGKNRPV